LTSSFNAPGLRYLYLGDDTGRIQVLNIDSYYLSSYTINISDWYGLLTSVMRFDLLVDWCHSAGEPETVNKEGEVTCLQTNPVDSNQLLIAYSFNNVNSVHDVNISNVNDTWNGMVVLWDLQAKKMLKQWMTHSEVCIVVLHSLPLISFT
jgi:hypothetical protein